MTGKKLQDSEDSRSLRLIRAFLSHRRIVIALFAFFTLICAICIPQVRINYDLSSYLPQESNSSQAMDLMDEIYGTEIPNTRLYAQGISIPQATELAADLKPIEGVNDLVWLGDQVDMSQPLEILDQETVESWMTDEGFLFQLTIADEQAATALEQVRSTALSHGATNVALSGDSVTTVNAQQSTSQEILIIMLLAVLIIIVIISLTSESWFEPVIFLLVLGIAIVMNMGTNIILGEISFITQICAAVLQLAVSMDYAIVMLHTFRRYQKEYPDDPLRAMTHAVHKGFSVILSSAAVTFFGFLSLCVMSFLIGVDMGLVLAKGIFFSFLAVMFLMPCIILACHKPLKRFEHRPLLPSFDRFGAWCTRLMIPLSVVICILAVPAFLGQSRTDFSYGAAGFAEEGSQLATEEALINDTFNSSETWIMIVPEGQWAHEKELTAALEALPKVSSVVSYVTTVSERIPPEMVPDSQLSQLISQGHTRIVIQTTLDENSGPDYDMVQEVRSLGQQFYGDDSYLAGSQVTQYDLKVITHEDSARVKLFSLGTIALVLIIMFRSLSIPLIVLLPIEISIWINLAVPYFTGQSINYIGYLVIDAVQLGASVDYAIIYTREYLEQRQKYPARQAARVAISKSATTIMTSALILTIAGVSIFLVASNNIISEIGMLVGRGAFISMLMMFTLLPLLFVMFDWIIRHTTLGLKFFKSSESSSKARSSSNLESSMNREAPMATKTSRKIKRDDIKKGTLALICSVVLIVSSVPAQIDRASATPNSIEASDSSAGSSATSGSRAGSSAANSSTASNSSAGSSTESGSASDGSVASSDTSLKEEVVYSKISNTGDVEGIYVVNKFNTDEETIFSDPGNYSSVINLSTTDNLEVKDGVTTFTSPEGEFLYKGELPSTTSLPWDISISYFLDGEETNADDLAGKSGALQILLDIAPSSSGDSIYSDNYLLQASGSFSDETTKNLSSEDGSLATAGSSKQLTFMMIPGSTANYVIEADVTDFTFDGFTIAGIPLSLALDLESIDTTELTTGMDDLKDAVSQLDEGASSLQEGSDAVGTGISTLHRQNSTLKKGSEQVLNSLDKASSGVDDLAQGSQLLTDSLESQASDASTKAQGASASAASKQQDYATAMTGAQQSLQGSSVQLQKPADALRNDDPTALRAALAQLETELNNLGKALSDINTSVGSADQPGLVSYQAQAAAYSASAETCSTINSSYSKIDDGLQTMTASLPELESNYALFDEGLNTYLNGVATLDKGYATFQEGLSIYKEGTQEFKSQTATIDQELIASMKDELGNYLNPEFELHSFVEPSNTAVSSVQFIYMTDPIDLPESEPVAEEEPAEETLWLRFLALFGL